MELAGRKEACAGGGLAAPAGRAVGREPCCRRTLGMPTAGRRAVPGSSPGGSRVIRRWGWNRRPGKNLFTYRYRERLETDSVVGQSVEKKRLNKWFTWKSNHHLRRPQAPFHSPEGEEALRPPRSDLRSPGRISRLDGYTFQMGIQPGKQGARKKRHGGISHSRN